MDVPLRDFPQRWREHLRTAGLATNSKRSYTTDVTDFIQTWRDVWFMSGHNPDAVTVDEDAFRNYAFSYLGECRLTLAASTVCRRLSALRKLGEAVFGNDHDHLHGYKPPVVGGRHPHPLPEGLSDVDAMLAVTDNPLHQALIVLCGKVGLRITEARMLRHQDFAADNSGQMWVSVRGKGDKTRRVPVIDDAWPYIEPFWNPLEKNVRMFDIGDRAARSAITRAGKAAGVSRRVASHDLRMTFGTAVYGATKDIRATQELLGHANVETTQVYTGITEATMKAAVLRGIGGRP